MSKPPRKEIPRVRKAKNTQYRRSLLKLSIPSFFDFVRENESELDAQKSHWPQTSPLAKVLSNPWVVGITSGILVWAVTSVYW
jgi:hypothetical protein